MLTLRVEAVGVIKVRRRNANETVQSRKENRYLMINDGSHQFVRLSGKFNSL